MIPVTYPSSLSYRTTRQMVAYPITDLTGKRRWTDYIPVKFVDQTTFTVENSHNNNAYISVDMLSSNANLKEGIDYIPVYIDNAATDAWQVSATGYIPVGYSGAALSLQFAGSTFLDSRITFTRASSGTYFDNTGVLRRANRNLLLRSEEFSNASWDKILGATVSANTDVAPDGATTADRATITSGGYVRQLPSVSITAGASYAVSVWVKKPSTGGATAIRITTNNTGAWNTGISQKFTLTSDWQRITATGNIISSGTGAYIIFGSADIAGNADADCVGDVLLWGAQLEEGSTATQYAKTVASTSGAPRFDHDPVTKAPRGLLIEEQRTNLLTYSEDFTNAAWNKIRSSITANTVVAPDGTLTADKLVEDTTATNSHSVWQSPAGLPDSTTHVFSVYAKAAERSRILVAFMDKAGTTRGMFFDLSAGTISTYNNNDPSIFGIQSVGNGWYRCWVGQSTSTGALGPRAWVFLTNGTTEIYTGDGTSGVHLWGAQLEAGSFATSYIPTTAAQVTRSADSASMTGSNFSSWYRADEGVMFAEFAFAQTYSTASSAAFAIDDGTANNELVLRTNQSHTAFSYTAALNGTNLTNVSNVALGTMSAGVFGKSAIAYKSGDSIATANGALGTASTTGFAAGAMTTARIGNNRTFGQALNGHIRKLAFYPARLANAQLQALTR